MYNQEYPSIDGSYGIGLMVSLNYGVLSLLLYACLSWFLLSKHVLFGFVVYGWF